MAITRRVVTQRRESVQYDGTNGQEIAVGLFDADPASVRDDGETLAFRHPVGPVYRVQRGGHILFVDNRGVSDGYCDWLGFMPTAAFDRRYAVDLEARLAALEAQVAATGT